MQHSVPLKMAPTLPKFLAEEKERVPRSLKPVLRGREVRDCFCRGGGGEEEGEGRCTFFQLFS